MLINQTPSNTSFGAVRMTMFEKRIMDATLNKRDAQIVQDLIKAEESNPIDVKLKGYPIPYAPKHNDFVVEVEGKKFRDDIKDFFKSSSTGMLNKIKRGIDYARELAKKD